MNKIKDAKTINLKHTPDNECVYSPNQKHIFVTMQVCKCCGTWKSKIKSEKS